MDYKSGIRANARYELIVDSEIAMYFGALFFRAVNPVHPRSVLGIRGATKDEASPES